jgi:hypothetical protein
MMEEVTAKWTKETDHARPLRAFIADCLRRAVAEQGQGGQPENPSVAETKWQERSFKYRYRGGRYPNQEREHYAVPAAYRETEGQGAAPGGGGGFQGGGPVYIEEDGASDECMAMLEDLLTQVEAVSQGTSESIDVQANLDFIGYNCPEPIQNTAAEVLHMIQYGGRE